ncbi:hypothetical protein GUITHDRAFT_151494 [Guillardia theta CCMP2712]|uniref:tRNA (guanine-N(7)-)-methyltransferase n=2 Tax=Guillardia theta TaxID=55529 RepID=L1JLR0_GUITC|nr:hypothetical protein GUITHDRAFT_151494 [Guillardia theta CCMP2712]EKX49282.1 hypothetical protein GUITHDRAFT_151494 [Guillardia theta CCMP2712]|eukprot:XP_005836262.1 hypothetical protein GUITHDRAFT_151494 [Guillardia theta CCMP2712]
MSGYHANSGRHFTVEVEDDTGGVKKRKFRSRAHANPLADPQFEYPVSPDCVDWSVLYPELCGEAKTMPRPVEYADIGCGFGGLLVKLGERFPDKISIGVEIREKVASYVDQRIKALRNENKGRFQNISVVRTNAMKCIANFFVKGSLEKLFFCFADPHFKTKNHRRRIINRNSISEFAYVLKEGGFLYVVTDVKELHDWQVEHLNAHPLFEKLDDDAEKADPCWDLMFNSSEEANKVERNEGSKFGAIYRRISLAEAVARREKK